MDVLRIAIDGQAGIQTVSQEGRHRGRQTPGQTGGQTQGRDAIGRRLLCGFREKGFKTEVAKSAILKLA